MPTTSAIPAVKTQLVAVLGARAGLAGVSVSYSWPGTMMPQGGSAIEAIFLGSASSVEVIPAMKAGRKIRQETIDLDVVIWVIRPADGPDAASGSETRAYELMAELENALADDTQIGLSSTALQWAEITGHHVDHAPAQKGWGTQIIAKVRCHSRLT